MAQAQAISASEMSILKANADKAAAAAAASLESVQRALSEAEAGNKTLASVNATLEEKIVQVQKTLSTEMQEALSQANIQSSNEIASLTADAEKAAAQAADALAAERSSLEIVTAEKAELVGLVSASKELEERLKAALTEAEVESAKLTYDLAEAHRETCGLKEQAAKLQAQVNTDGVLILYSWVL